MEQPPPAPAGSPHDQRPAGRLRLAREPDDRKIAGVCSGLADLLGIDVTVVRVVAVVLAFITPVALIAYLVASVVVPERPPDQPRARSQQMHLGKVPHPVIVVGAVVAVAAIVDDAWWLNPLPAAVALVGVGVWLILRERDDGDDPQQSAEPALSTTPPPTEPEARTVAHPMASSPWLAPDSQELNAQCVRGTTMPGGSTDTAPTDTADATEAAGHLGELTPPSSPWWPGGSAAPAPPTASPQRSSARLGPVIVALLLVAGGLIWMLDVVGAASLSVRGALAVGLIVIGAGLIVAAWWGRAFALVPVGLAFAGLLVTGDVLTVAPDAGVGERTVVVDSARELRRDHELFLGELTIDLTDAPLSAVRTTTVEADVGAGELRVIVPADAVVEVDAAVKAGEVRAPAEARTGDGGLGVRESFDLEGAEGGPRLALDLSLGLGTLEVSRG
jgi:phage shock protein PspC (stress-responsive transcriptional regulator)